MGSLRLSENGTLVLWDDEDGSPPCSTTTDPVKVETVSVSQLTSYERCPSRWFFQKVRRVHVPQKDSSAKNVGTEIHSLIEGYFKRGSIPQGHKHERKVRKAVEHLPVPDPALLIEYRFKVPRDIGPAFTGVIDFIDPRHSDRVDVVDHKTSGDVTKPRPDLTKDSQMLTYAEVGYRTFDTPSVRVAHNTISTKHVDRVLPLNWTEIPRDMAAANWERQQGVIKDMVSLASSPPADWTDVPRNTNACRDFGGCDFLPICSLRTPLIGAQKMSYDVAAASDLLARLKAMNTATPPPAEEPLEEPVALLPPDAPSRETPAEEEPVVKPKRIKTSRKADRVLYEYLTEKLVESVTQEYLDGKGDDGWQLVGFEGATVIFLRAK